MISKKSSQFGGIPGKRVVVLLYALALFMGMALLIIGLSQKGRVAKSIDKIETGDTLTVYEPDSLNALLQSLPSNWLPITHDNEKGFVILIPCYSDTASISWIHMPNTAPRLVCPFCESGETLTVSKIKIALNRNHLKSESSGLQIVFSGDSTRLEFVPAQISGDSVTSKNRPIWSKWPNGLAAMLWHRGQESSYFAPREALSQFEVVHAKDENPEGCGSNEEATPEGSDSTEIGSPAEE